MCSVNCCSHFLFLAGCRVPNTQHGRTLPTPYRKGTNIHWAGCEEAPAERKSGTVAAGLERRGMIPRGSLASGGDAEGPLAVLVVPAAVMGGCRGSLALGLVAIESLGRPCGPEVMCGEAISPIYYPSPKGVSGYPCFCQPFAHLTLRVPRCELWCRIFSCVRVLGSYYRHCTPPLLPSYTPLAPCFTLPLTLIHRASLHSHSFLFLC
ncbi:hypothetical protein BDZ91DRAFT_261707 [Kalaharituber pfeilii]|nr:hypothetical protein BDZ91DRAFT_261707 [Kalaharituber pfeilii]